ncbi:MAG: hypothetical protein ACRENB_01265 [Gemmatimonadales bacterium]
MTAPDATRASRGAAGVAGDPLVPLLPTREGAPDPVAISTWHLALATSVASEVGHDLFALWLFPASGGSVLLGPSALGQDHVVVPEPSPHFLQDQLFALEEVLRRAKYESAIAVPIRGELRDVGMMLLGAFRRRAYGPVEAAALQRLAARLGPPLASLGSRMGASTPHTALEPTMTLEALPEHLARATCDAADGSDLVRRASGILYPLLPHDRLEILVQTAQGSWSPLSGLLPRRRWTPTGGAIDPLAAVIARFDTEPTLLIDDLTESVTDAQWTADPSGGSSLPIRGLLGSRLVIAGETVGFLILGSVARDAYHPDDEELAATASTFLAPRVAGLRLELEREGRRTEGTAASLPNVSLVRASQSLADTGHLGAALALFDAQLQTVVPHESFAIHLRWGEDEVIWIDPDSLRPPADLPAQPLQDFDGAPLLRGDRGWMVRTVNGTEEVMLPLRVAGRPVGTLSLRSGAFPSPREAAALAQPFADILAPHLELLRRAARPAQPRSLR